MPVVRLLNVSRAFDGVKALDGIQLHVPRGVVMGILGPGGAGKTTLCRVIATLVKPDSGVVTVDGIDVIRADRRALAAIRRRLGVQFQNDALFEHMTVRANVEYPLRRHGELSDAAIRERAAEHLAMVGLLDFGDRMPSRLSGGQRRRVALARACATDPDLLVCDDPTAGLDPVTSRRILDMIVGIRYQTDNTVIIVSSDVLGLLSIADRVTLLWGGRVTAEGTPASFARDERREVKRFIDDARLPIGGAGWS